MNTGAQPSVCCLWLSDPASDCLTLFFVSLLPATGQKRTPLKIMRGFAVEAGFEFPPRDRRIWMKVSPVSTPQNRFMQTDPGCFRNGPGGRGKANSSRGLLSPNLPVWSTLTSPRLSPGALKSALDLPGCSEIIYSVLPASSGTRWFYSLHTHSILSKYLCVS